MAFGPADLSGVLRSQAAVFERLHDTIGEEYAREAKNRPQSPHSQLALRINRLLASELIDTSDIDYDFNVHHIGAITEGDAGARALGYLSKSIDARILVVRPYGEVVWAWIGTRHKVEREILTRSVSSTWPKRLPLALGEPGLRSAGWRLTHAQALAAWPMITRSSDGVVHYADVAMDAAIFRDRVLTSSLRQIFLDPLSQELRETLRAFFSAQRNVSSAAIALGVKRHTVTSRLRRIEERLDRPLSNCAPALEAALRLEELAL
jgi:hypothetical protein